MRDVVPSLLITAGPSLLKRDCDASVGGIAECGLTEGS